MGAYNWCYNFKVFFLTKSNYSWNLEMLVSVLSDSFIDLGGLVNFHIWPILKEVLCFHCIYCLWWAFRGSRYVLLSIFILSEKFALKDNTRITELIYQKYFRAKNIESTNVRANHYIPFDGSQIEDYLFLLWLFELNLNSSEVSSRL